MKKLAIAALTIAAWFSMTLAASAQFYGEGTIGANGIVRLPRTAERMRMQVDVLSRAGEIREAIKGLEGRTAAARTKLLELGAIADTLKIAEPTLVVEDNAQRQQLEQMIAQSLRSSGRGKKPAAVARPVTVSARLTAEWKLDDTGIAEQLVKAHELQAALREADVSGSKEASQLSPEEQEILEESEMLSSYNAYNTEAKPGEPVFYFVASIGDEEYTQALADAFKKAKSEAAMLAGAAGSKLGKLESLTVNNSGAPDYSNYGYGQSYQAYQMLQNFGVFGESDSAPDASDHREAIGTQPGIVQYTLTVSAGFHIAE